MNTLKLKMIVAHRIAKNLIEENKNIDYKAQVGINIEFLNKKNKEATKMLLENLTIEELNELKVNVEKAIKEKENKDNKVFTFEFNYSNDPRKGIPYAARLSINDKNKINREFFELNKINGKSNVTVEGTYEATKGDIIEEREGGSWKNDYRYWYLINEEGKKIRVADIDDSKEKLQVTKYLKNEISYKELLETTK